MKIQEGKFLNGRGQVLHTVTYVPDRVTCVLLLHHGYGEHANRYKHVFKQLAVAGVALHSYDCASFGRSEPSADKDRHLIWDFQALVDDFAAFGKEVRTQHEAGVPIFLGGHSMGALAALHLALRDQSGWAGLVLGTATVDVGEWTWLLRLQASVGNILASIIPRARIVPALRPEDFEPGAEDIHELDSDPLLATGNIRARTANELLKAFRHVSKEGHKLALPIYAHHGTNDHLASLGAVKRLLARVASRDVTLYLVEGGYHELFLGPEQEDVTQHIIAWLHEQVQLGISDVS